MEWEVDNQRQDWVEPVTTYLTYFCADGTRQKKGIRKLGPFPPSEMRKGGIRDKGIYPGSDIQSVEVDIELHSVSERVKKVWE